MYVQVICPVASIHSIACSVQQHYRTDIGWKVQPRVTRVLSVLIAGRWMYYIIVSTSLPRSRTMLPTIVVLSYLFCLCAGTCTRAACRACRYISEVIVVSDIGLQYIWTPCLGGGVSFAKIAEISIRVRFSMLLLTSSFGLGLTLRLRGSLRLTQMDYSYTAVQCPEELLFRYTKRPSSCTQKIIPENPWPVLTCQLRAESDVRYISSSVGCRIEKQFDKTMEITVSLMRYDTIR